MLLYVLQLLHKHFSTAGQYPYNIVLKYPYAINKIISLTFDIASLYDLTLSNHDPVSDGNNIDKNTYNIAVTGGVGLYYWQGNTAEEFSENSDLARPLLILNATLKNNIENKDEFNFQHSVIASGITNPNNSKLNFDYPMMNNGTSINSYGDWISSYFGLFGVKDQPGILTATVITDFYKWDIENNNYITDEIAIPLTSNITASFDYAVNLEPTSSIIEITNKNPCATIVSESGLTMKNGQRNIL
jgi:hypothetical protein